MTALLHVPLITIVDDDDGVRRSLADLIRSFRLRTEDYASSEAFLESGRIDDAACLILDVRMPGMSGLELQSRIRATKSLVPIIFVTSYADEHARARAFGDGAVAFLPKPVRSDELRSAIDAAIGAW